VAETTNLYSPVKTKPVSTEPIPILKDESSTRPSIFSYLKETMGLEKDFSWVDKAPFAWRIFRKMDKKSKEGFEYPKQEVWTRVEELFNQARGNKEIDNGVFT